ncbi:hypothetical protein EWM64_g6648 [Hericium alpestre]|uniref:Uncharacterized protein n=1 Tax=Hericium alpestre TaxID=135208 RepID=A0A4Y9ZTL1_9AGAM|nr:hypothetical protein EWM64_g6648 [Hericium alpestre]
MRGTREPRHALFSRDTGAEQRIGPGAGSKTHLFNGPTAGVGPPLLLFLPAGGCQYTIRMDQSVTIDDTFGAALIGLLFGAVLYGVTNLQTWLYFRHYDKDPRALKALVLVLWFLDTLHLALCARTIYWYLVTNYSNPSALANNMWSMSIQTDCNGLIGLMVEV